MNKQLILEKYIKVAVRKALKEQEEQQKRAEKALYLIYRFPGLKKLMEDLMSPVFGRFIGHVEIVAPKPTTFDVKLINGQDFSIIYVGKGNFTVKISGKKYNPNNLGELERASQSIADLLQLNYAPEEGKEQQSSSEAGIKSDLEQGAKEAPPAEEKPAEEEAPVAESLKKKVKSLNEIFMSVLNEDIDDDILDALISTNDKDKAKVLKYLQRVSDTNNNEGLEAQVAKLLKPKLGRDDLIDQVIYVADSKKFDILQELKDYLQKPTIGYNDLLSNTNLNDLFAATSFPQDFTNKIINIKGSSQPSLGKGEVALIVFLEDTYKGQIGDVVSSGKQIEIKSSGAKVMNKEIATDNKNTIIETPKFVNILKKYRDLAKGKTWVEIIQSIYPQANDKAQYIQEVNSLLKDLYPSVNISIKAQDLESVKDFNNKIAVSIANTYLKDQDLLFLNPETNDYIYIKGYEDYVNKIYDGTLIAKNASDKVPRIYY